MQNKLSSLIPDSFYQTPEIDNKMGLYTSMERKEFNKVMRILCDRMIRANCSSKTDIIQITSLAIDKFPGLKGSFGGDNVSTIFSF